MSDISARKVNTNDLTEGTIWKKLLLFFVPIAVGTLLQQLYNAVDAVIVGRFVGTEALAAVGGSASLITSIGIGMFVALASGSSVIIAQRFGAKDGKGTSRCVGTALSSFVIIGLTMTVIMLFLSKPVLLLLKTPAETVADSVLYCRIYFAGTVFMIVFNIGSAILRAVGNSKMPLIYLAISCGSNIFLDLVFVLVFGLGVAGVAIATVLAQALSCVFILKDLIRTDEVYRIRRENIRPDWRIFGKMMKIGVPTCAQGCMYSISNLILTVAVNQLGTVVVASWSMSGKVDGVYWAISEAFGVAIMNFVAQNFGAGRPDRIRKGSRTGAIIFISFTVLLSCILLLVGKPLIGIFTPDPAVRETTWKVIVYFVPTYFTWSIIEALSGILRGVGDTLKPAIILAFGICAVRIIWVCTVFRANPTLLTVSLSYPVSWVVTDVALGIYYLTKRKSILLSTSPHKENP